MQIEKERIIGLLSTNRNVVIIVIVIKFLKSNNKDISLSC